MKKILFLTMAVVLAAWTPVAFGTYFEDFEASDGGYTHSGAQDEWEWGMPSCDVTAAYSGANCWGTDLDADYESSADCALYTVMLQADVDNPQISWYEAYNLETNWDFAYVEYSVNGGAWTSIATLNGASTTWAQNSGTITASTGDQIQVRWRLDSDSSFDRCGLYIDDVSSSDLSVSSVPTFTPPPTATPLPGDTCATAIVVDLTSLPYTDANADTCGLNDDCNDCFDASGCSSWSTGYDNGPDKFYTFTPASDITLQINMVDNGGGSYGSIIVFENCPGSGSETCLHEGHGNTVNDSWTGNFTAGNVYFIMIDNWPSPACISDYTLTITEITEPTATPTFTSTPLPTNTPAGPGDNCGNPIVINCGDCVTGSTVGMGADHDCGFGHSGPDVVYQLTLTDTYDVHFLGEADYDADWTISTACDTGPNAGDILCEDYSASSYDFDPTLSCGGITAANYSPLDYTTQLGPGTYYIWVDGYLSSDEGNYALEIECTIAPTPTNTPAETFTPTYTPSPTTTPVPFACPPGSLLSQLPVDPSGSWSFGTSDQASDARQYDDYTVVGSICDIHWWGLDLEYVSGTGWVEGSKDVDFDIIFYTDNAGSLGTEVARRTVHPTKVETSWRYYGYTLNYYSATFVNCVNLQHGWVAVVAHEDPAQPNVYFLWGNSEDGNLSSISYDGTSYSTNSFDRAMCLTGVVITTTPTNTPAETFTPTPLPTATPTAQQCPAGSLFSQTFDWQNGYGSDDDNGWEMIDNYSITGAICDIHWWGIAAGGPASDFTITFYNDNGGQPGTVYTQRTVTATYVDSNMDAFGYDVYYYSVNFAACINLQSGWVSIVEGAGNGSTFYWCTSSDGDLQSFDGSGTSYATDLAFCLTGMTTTATPTTGPSFTPTATPTPTMTPAVAGDHCSNAIDISGDINGGSFPVTIAGDSTSATDTYQLASCSYYGGAGHDLVYMFTPATDMNLIFDTCASTGMGDTVLYFLDTCPPTSDIRCGDDSDVCGSGSYLTYLGCGEFHAGVTYYLVVDGWGSSDYGAFTLTIDECSFPECPTDTIFEQPQHHPDENWVFSASDVDASNTIYDNFSGLTADIEGVRWFGAFYDASAGAVCSKTVDFTISFYADNGGAPASLPSYVETVTPTTVVTDNIYGSYGLVLVQFDATFATPVSMTDGWISIVAESDSGNTDCHFFWLDSGTGDLSSYTYDGTTMTAQTYDYSMCLTGTAAPPVPTITPGAVPVTGPVGLGLLIFVLSALLGLSTIRKR